MAELAESTREAVGQPSSVRIGTVTSTSPLVVSVQGALFNSAALGVLSSYTPAAGDVVILLGQSTTTGSDPTSWVILGQVLPGN